MAKSPSVDWTRGEQSERVSIGSHKLNLSSCGPDRRPGAPAVVIITGLSSSTKSWAAVQRLLAPFVRTYLYDRSGYGGSDTSPMSPTSMTIASELDTLLVNAKIHPPFILVAHSWGGILGREFLTLRPNDVIGMVFIEANQENTLEVLDWRDPTLWLIAKDVDFYEVTGLTDENKLTEEEWQAYQDDETSLKHQQQAANEMEEYSASFPVLSAKNQLHRDPPLLGDHPVSIIQGQTERDFQRLYQAGVRKGNGNDQQRAAYREKLRTWHEKNKELQVELLSLSRNSRHVEAWESGHHVQLTQPDLIANEVKWVIDNF